ncbi:MAG: transporter substrate-binding domain-containing protein, partial [Angelakisella sp.]
YEFHILDENGKDKIVGFDIALAQAIADDMGLALEIKDIAFDNILLELNAGTIDLGISGFSPDPERAKAVDFSKLYYTGGQSMMINKADASKFKTYTDLNDKQFSVGAQTGSIQEALAKELTANANYVGLQAVPSVIMELKAGKINAAFMETVVAEGYAQAQDDLMVLCEVPYDVEGSAVAVKKGNEEMMKTVNKVIDKLLADGTMDKYIQEGNALSVKAIAK